MLAEQQTRCYELGNENREPRLERYVEQELLECQQLCHLEKVAPKQQPELAAYFAASFRYGMEENG